MHRTFPALIAATALLISLTACQGEPPPQPTPTPAPQVLLPLISEQIPPTDAIPQVTSGAPPNGTTRSPETPETRSAINVPTLPPGDDARASTLFIPEINTAKPASPSAQSLTQLKDSLDPQERACVSPQDQSPQAINDALSIHDPQIASTDTKRVFNCLDPESQFHFYRTGVSDQNDVISEAAHRCIWDTVRPILLEDWQRQTAHGFIGASRMFMTITVMSVYCLSEQDLNSTDLKIPNADEARRLRCIVDYSGGPRSFIDKLLAGTTESRQDIIDAETHCPPATENATPPVSTPPPTS